MKKLLCFEVTIYDENDNIKDCKFVEAYTTWGAFGVYEKTYGKVDTNDSYISKLINL